VSPSNTAQVSTPVAKAAAVDVVAQRDGQDMLDRPRRKVLRDARPAGGEQVAPAMHVADYIGAETGGHGGSLDGQDGFNFVTLTKRAVVTAASQ
jgi:hypothetical protein